MSLFENEKPHCIKWAYKMFCSCAVPSNKSQTDFFQYSAIEGPSLGGYRILATLDSKHT